MLLWVTRSSPFNIRTRRTLAELGHRSITAPVLHIRQTGTIGPAAEPTAIAVTSEHVFRHRPMEEAWRSLPIFTVDEHCARAARESGYEDVRSAGGNVMDLRDLILGSISRFGHVVHLGAREPAGDLVDDLRRAGLSAELSVIYESVEATSEHLKGVAVGLPFVDGIIVHSPKGARVAAELVRRAGWHGLVFSLSEPCAEPFERTPGIAVEIAPAPTETSLMDMIAEFRVPAFRPLGGARIPGEPHADDENGATSRLRLVVSNDARKSGAADRRSPPVPEDDPPPFAA
jgi:uroporphyrinogen-III synthase